MHVETVNKRKSADIPVDIIAHRLNTCTAVDNTVFTKTSCIHVVPRYEEDLIVNRSNKLVK